MTSILVRLLRVHPGIRMAGILSGLLVASVLQSPAVEATGVVSILGTIQVGTNPVDIGVNPQTNRIYVANSNNSVSVIDGTSDTVVATIPTNAPFSVAVNPTTNRIYVGTAPNTANATVSVIDGSSNAITAVIPIFGQLLFLAVNPTTNRIYAANGGFAHNVQVIDGSTNTVVAAIPAGNSPTGIAVNSATNRVYVANQLDNTVSVIDASSNSVIATVPVGNRPVGQISVSVASNRIYVGDEQNTITVIDGATNTALATIPVAQAVLSTGVNDVTGHVFGLQYFANSVAIIDRTSNAVIQTLSLGPNPGGNPYNVAVNSATGKVYVTGFTTGLVYVLSDPLPSPGPLRIEGTGSFSLTSDTVISTRLADGNVINVDEIVTPLAGVMSGTGVSDVTVIIHPSGAREAHGTFTFTGSVAGIGSGTLVGEITDQTTFLGVLSGQITLGSGTGDLAGVRGVLFFGVPPPTYSVRFVVPQP
jgi:YVTN family beta-propeller protein